MTDAPLIELEHVSKHYRGGLRAVRDVSLALEPGRTLGIVGESGSGKSTIARLVLGLEQPSAGTLRFGGAPYPSSARGMRPIRRRIAMVFQDPYESLDPRFTLRAIVEEPLRAQRLPRDERRIRDLLATVGMADARLDSYAAEYSGGQRQRVGIARALAAEPELVVCDEPTSALDVSVQAQILNLLLDLQRDRGLAYLFISHDLEVVRRVSDEIAVMYAGAVVEYGPAVAVTSNASHPYTQALMAAVPAATPSERHLAADAQGTASGALPVEGCPFAPRCMRRQVRCEEEVPALEPAGDTLAACYFPLLAADEPESVDAAASGGRL